MQHIYDVERNGTRGGRWNLGKRGNILLASEAASLRNLNGHAGYRTPKEALAARGLWGSADEVISIG